jgi:4-amino-4-deoxy-L-arabinose transferase-like glycosyltransferase
MYERLAPTLAVIAAIAAAGAGAVWGTHVAGGQDSYSYLSQAELFASGQVAHTERLASIAPWPHGADAFVPVGHVPAARHVGASVPMCSAGYPIAMAAARLVGGRTAMFAIVPLCGAVAVWLTFVLGRRIAGAAAGAIAALLLAASPPFLYQVVQPMSDVPAAAAWAGALVSVTNSRFTASFAWAAAGGIVTGMALLVRPNLAPLGIVVALVVFTVRPIVLRTVMRTWVAFAVGALPSVITVVILQNAMYGGPLTSGYGDLSLLFRLEHVWPNLQRYPLWLIQTETPIVLVAVAAPWLTDDSLTRRRVLWLLAYIVAVFSCYIPYEVFDAWWFLRFLLPAYPALLVLTSSALVWSFERRRSWWRIAPYAAAAIVAVVLVRESIRRHAFGLWEFERRFELAGEYVASKLPPNALVIAAQETGSVRFYANRETIAWRALPAETLDTALAFVRAHGYQPYFLIETGEQQEFVDRFESKSPLGGLGWPPIADINHMLRIYDPDDYAKYRAGERVTTERIWTKNERVLARFRF